MLSRSLAMVSVAAVAGIAIAVLMAVRGYTEMHAAERSAAASLLKIKEAQQAFRARVGRTAYATDLASLTTPCPGDARALLAPENLVAEYRVVVRAAEHAMVIGSDCHGRPMASDYYAAAQPVTPVSGQQAFAMTSRTRIYVFFDGLAPRESDLGPGGLAIPLDTLDTFKIP